MEAFEAMMKAERLIPATRKEVVKAWAFLIKTGLAFELQGWYGRTAKVFIEAGVISKEGEINWDKLDALEEE